MKQLDSGLEEMISGQKASGYGQMNLQVNLDNKV